MDALAEENERVLHREETVPAWAVALAGDFRGAMEELKQVKTLTNVNCGRIDQLFSKIEALQKTSEENHRTLRGYNGTRGIAERLECLETRLENIAETLQDHRNDFEGEQGELKSLAAAIEESKLERARMQAQLENKNSGVVTWNWIIEKLGAPIAVGLIMLVCPLMIALAVLAQYFLPNLLQVGP